MEETEIGEVGVDKLNEKVAIGLSAIAALIERRSIWLIALVGGIFGIGLFLHSIV